MAALRNCHNLPRTVSSALIQSKTGNPTNIVQSTSNLIRCFSSSSVIQARGITEKGKQKAQAKHDAKLRHAIDLYHTSRHFYPTRPTITGQTKVGLISYEEFQDYSEEEVILRSFDEEIDWIVRANLFMLKKGDQNENNLDKVLGPLSMRSGSALVDHLEKQRTISESKDLNSYIEDESQAVIMQEIETLPIRSPDGPLPDPNDTQAMKQYIAEAVRRTSLGSREKYGQAPRHALRGGDQRILRIRDALFGTVQGSLPGLEIVRERSTDPRVQEEAKRLIKEAKEAREKRALQEKGETLQSDANSSPSVQ